MLCMDNISMSQNNQGYTPLSIAIENADTELTDSLLDNKSGLPNFTTRDVINLIGERDLFMKKVDSRFFEDPGPS